MLSGSHKVKLPVHGRKRGSTKEELGNQLKGIISDIDIDRIDSRKKINEQLRKITSLHGSSPAIERLENEKETGTGSTIDEIIDEIDLECQRLLDSI